MPFCKFVLVLKKCSNRSKRLSPPPGFPPGILEIPTRGIISPAAPPPLRCRNRCYNNNANCSGICGGGGGGGGISWMGIVRVGVCHGEVRPGEIGGGWVGVKRWGWGSWHHNLMQNYGHTSTDDQMVFAGALLIPHACLGDKINPKDKGTTTDNLINLTWK